MLIGRFLYKVFFMLLLVEPFSCECEDDGGQVVRGECGERGGGDLRLTEMTFGVCGFRDG